MSEPNFPEVSEQSQVANLSQVRLETVKAELVRMHQSAANEIQAEDVELNLSAVANANSTHLSANRSALALVEATEVTTQNSVVAAAQAERISFGGAAGMVLAGSAELNHSYVGILTGQEVHAEKIDTIFLLSRNVEGNVTTIFDARSTLIVGLIAGLFAGLMVLLGRMLFGRK